MPDGQINKENIVLNEISMWSGSKQDTDNPEAYKSLAQIRKLLFEGKNDEAQSLMYKTFVCKGLGSGQGNGADTPYGSYQLLGNLVIEYQYPNETDTISQYKRTLNLNDAEMSEFTLQLRLLQQRVDAAEAFGVPVRVHGDMSSAIQAFARLSSRTSCSSSRIRACSSVVTPAFTPSSISAWRTQARTDSTP